MTTDELNVDVATRLLSLIVRRSRRIYLRQKRDERSGTAWHEARAELATFLGLIREDKDLEVMVNGTAVPRRS